MKKSILKLDFLKRHKVQQIYCHIRDIIRKNLWVELLFMVALGLIVSGIVFIIVSHFIYSIGLGNEIFISYEDSRAYIQGAMLERAARVSEETSGIIDDEEALEIQINDIVNSEFNSRFVVDSRTYLVDGSGKIMYPDGVVDSLNLNKVIQKANANEYSEKRSKFVAIYPVIIQDQVCYLYNESTLQPFSYREFTNIGNILALITSGALFVLIIFRLTRDKIAYIEYLTACLGEISKGNLNYSIEIVGADELARVAQSITHMENELRYQIEEKIKTEKSKNELVTNVAHDLRTPLTSIIGYIGLVKTKEHNSEEAEKYLEIAYNKAEKLKIIIEDLFELTKLHQGKMELKKSEISLSNLLHQLIEELMPLASEKNITMEAYIDLSNSNVLVDVGKITRVFENLIENAIKYTPNDESIYIETKNIQDKIYIAISNPSPQVSQEEIDKYFERFYRADESRNSTGGSGLGLAIAKNIVELHGGSIEAKLNMDLLCFKVTLPRKK